MYQHIVNDAAEKFDLKIRECSSAQKGYRNESYRLTLISGEDVNLIFHKNETEALKRIKSADKAASPLSGIFPIRTRFDKRTLTLSDDKNIMYAGVYTYLPGETIPWEAYTKNHIKLLGWAMSDMHAVWRDLDSSLPGRVDDELSLLCGRMKRYFDSLDVRRAMKEKLGLALKADFAGYDQLLERLQDGTSVDEHVLHMDFVRGNVLFSASNESDIWRIGGVSISGVIDFEKAAVGHPVYDIARTLAFLLVDCVNKDRHSVYKYFLESGYNKRGMSSFERNDNIGGLPAHKVLNMLVGFFLLHDFYKFLKHTPYESLEDNHHFIRTRDILIDYGMIRLNKD